MLSFFQDMLLYSSELYFLLILTCWTLIVIGLAYGIKHFILLRPYKQPTNLPLHPDPYEIAFLRSPYDLIRVSVFSLLRQGLLHMSKSRRSVKRTSKRPTTRLHPVDLIVYDHIETGPYVYRLLRDPKLQGKLETLYADQAWTMERKGYLVTNETPYTILKMAALVLVLGLGAFKLSTYEFGQGFFTVLLMLILYSVVRLSIRSPRITAKGKKAIADFTDAYAKPELINAKDHRSVLLGLSVGDTDLLPAKLKDKLDLDFETRPPGSATNGWYAWSGSIRTGGNI